MNGIIGMIPSVVDDFDKSNFACWNCGQCENLLKNISPLNLPMIKFGQAG